MHVCVGQFLCNAIPSMNVAKQVAYESGELIAIIRCAWYKLEERPFIGVHPKILRWSPNFDLIRKMPQYVHYTRVIPLWSEACQI